MTDSCAFFGFFFWMLFFFVANFVRSVWFVWCVQTVGVFESGSDAGTSDADDATRETNEVFYFAFTSLLHF
jgi:hypothetical protein